MMTDETSRLFHEAFPTFAGVAGLIIDLRHNGGGSSSVGWSILSRLLTEPAPTAATRYRVYVPTCRAWGGTQRWLALPGSEVRPHEELPLFTGPVAALTSPMTGSAAEDFVLTAFNQISQPGP